MLDDEFETHKGYIGAGIRVPVHRPEDQSEQTLHVDTRLTSVLIRRIRARGE
jgi:hypothetical protein